MSLTFITPFIFSLPHACSILNNTHYTIINEVINTTDGIIFHAIYAAA
jgi:hypothetical protein